MMKKQKDELKPSHNRNLAQASTTSQHPIPDTAQVAQLQKMVDESCQIAQLREMQTAADDALVKDGEGSQNKTGLPDNLKLAIENQSGYSMNDVKVHYNSALPAQLQAHAYAQGTDIHLATGQEKHLPHEVWHVVQQKQGRVNPTVQLQGVSINDDAQLEKEAEDVGGKLANAAISSTVQMKTQGGKSLIDNPLSSRIVQKVDLSHKTSFDNFKAAVAYLISQKKKKIAYRKIAMLRSTGEWMRDSSSSSSSSGKHDTQNAARGFVFFRPEGTKGGVGSSRGAEYVVDRHILDDQQFFASSIDAKGKIPKSQFTEKQFKAMEKQEGKTFLDSKQEFAKDEGQAKEKGKKVADSLLDGKGIDNSEIGVWGHVTMDYIKQVKLYYGTEKNAKEEMLKELVAKKNELAEVDIEMKYDLEEGYFSVTFKEIQPVEEKKIE